MSFEVIWWRSMLVVESVVLFILILLYQKNEPRMKLQTVKKVRHKFSTNFDKEIANIKEGRIEYNHEVDDFIFIF
jgi:hypothetical protein